VPVEQIARLSVLMPFIEAEIEPVCERPDDHVHDVDDCWSLFVQLPV